MTAIESGMTIAEPGMTATESGTIVCSFVRVMIYGKLNSLILARIVL